MPPNSASSPQLTFKINGRDAVPVRAIPYVTSWKIFQPNMVVANLAGNIRTLKTQRDCFARPFINSLGVWCCLKWPIPPMTAYRIPFNTPIQIKTNEWLELEKQTKELCLRYENNAISDAVWKREFVELLPVDTFVWLDNLENVWKAICDYCIFIIGERTDNSELTLAPTLNADEMAMVEVMDDVVYKNIGKCLESYWETPWSELPDEQRKAWHEALGPFGGNVDMDGKEWVRDTRDKKLMAEQYDWQNDPALEDERFVTRCDYSMNAKTWLDMENVKPKDAAMLLHGLNPLDRKDPEHIFIGGDETSPRRYDELLLVFEGKASIPAVPRTLMQWLSIALERGLHYDSWIDKYVLAAGVTDDTPDAPMKPVKVKPTEEPNPWELPDPKDPSPKQPWYTPARYFAWQLIKDNPSWAAKNNTFLANKVGPMLVKVGIKKRGGLKPLSANTILKAFSNIDFS